VGSGLLPIGDIPPLQLRNLGCASALIRWQTIQQFGAAILAPSLTASPFWLAKRIRLVRFHVSGSEEQSW
jgi:hypothetical protein